MDPPMPPEPSIIQCVIGGENLPETEWQVELTVDEQPGLKADLHPLRHFSVCH